MKTVQEYVDKSLRSAAEALEVGYFEPHLVTYNRERAMSLIFLVTGDKESAKALARNAIKETEAETCLMLYEAWLAREDQKKPSGLMPSQNPDRIDALIVYGENKAGETGFGVLGVKKVNGRPKTYKLPPDHEYTDAVCSWDFFERTMN